MTPIISGLAEQNGQKKFRTSMAKTHVSKKIVRKGAIGPGPRVVKAIYDSRWSYLRFKSQVFRKEITRILYYILK